MELSIHRNSQLIKTAGCDRLFKVTKGQSIQKW